MKLELIEIAQARMIKSHSKALEVGIGLGEFGEFLGDRLD